MGQMIRDNQRGKLDYWSKEKGSEEVLSCWFVAFLNFVCSLEVFSFLFGILKTTVKSVKQHFFSRRNVAIVLVIHVRIYILSLCFGVVNFHFLISYRVLLTHCPTIHLEAFSMLGY